MLLYIILSVVLLLLATWAVYFFLYENKLKWIQSEIIQLFLSRTNSIIWLYEVTHPYLEKHAEVFEEILALRKKEFNLHEVSNNLEAFLELEAKIHHEFNFIYKVCNTHRKIEKEKRYLYMREIILEKSQKIWRKIHDYNTFVSKYNELIRYKNFSVLWLLLPFRQKKLLK